MRLLVTGASGLLGVNLALEATQAGHTVFGVDKSRRLRTTDFIQLHTDLLQPGAISAVLDESQPDWVIHCAALADVDACEENPELAQRLNADLPGELAEVVARHGARLAHISTDAVFDGQRGGYGEEDEPNPLSAYARGKLDGERAVAQANPEAVIARVNFYGWSPAGQRSLAEFFYNHLAAGEKMMGFTDARFCPLLANQLAEILFAMLAANLSGLYHVVSADCLSKYEFGLALAHQFGLDETLIEPASVHQAGLKAARAPNLTLRSDKLAQALGAPLPHVQSGLARLHQLFQQGYPQKLQQMLVAEETTAD